jgi:hypothetical protein
MRRLLALPLIALAVATAAPAAGAATCASAPGTSAVDQYCESIPGADGGKPVKRTKGAPVEAARDRLPAGTSRQLDGDDPDDAGLLAVVSTGPDRPSGGAAGGATTGGTATPGATATAEAPAQGAVDAGATPSSSPVSAVTAAASSGPTLGPGLPIALLGIALAGGALAWTRARS